MRDTEMQHDDVERNAKLLGLRMARGMVSTPPAAPSTTAAHINTSATRHQPAPNPSEDQEEVAVWTQQAAHHNNSKGKYIQVDFRPSTPWEWETQERQQFTPVQRLKILPVMQQSPVHP